MNSRVVTFKVERESNLGALYLVSNLPGHVSPQSDIAPALVYLDKLRRSGRRTQRGRLVRVARLLTGDTEAGLGDFPWSELKSGHVEFIKGLMRGTQDDEDETDYAPSAINATISAMRGVAKWAVHLEQMPREQYERLRAIPLVRAAGERRRPARALAIEEIDALFKSCEREGSLCALRDAALIALLYRGGLRLDEASALELSAYSRRAHTLMLRGKGGKRRSVYFDDGGARRALHAWLRLRGTWEGPLLCPVDRHGHVLRKQLSHKGLYTAVMRRGSLAGLDHFTVHDLRRSLGRHLEDEHTPIDIIRAVLGHSDIRTTQIYLMTGEKEKREASLKIKVNFRTSRRGRRRKRRRHKN
jgi:site-specific recombinase XerD